MKRLKYAAIVALLVVASACGSDDEASEECETDFAFNPISGVCEPTRTIDTNSNANNTETDAGTGDAGSDDAGGDPIDMGVDMPPDCVDLDNDGVCAEDDCDDENIAVAPGLGEICDIYDNDCNDELNDGIECAFYAHTNEELYLVDPFKYELEKVADTPITLLDIDTHPDGRLFAILQDFTLAVFDPVAKTWDPLPNSLGNVGNANGLAITNDGQIFVTSSGDLYTADINTGVATLVGSYSPYVSSGDAVVTKGGSLLMTSSHTATDSLVRLDGDTGTGTLRGDTGVDGIWGLTSAFGVLYGVTSTGRLAILDDATGGGTIIHVFEGLSFYGAASTPGR